MIIEAISYIFLVSLAFILAVPFAALGVSFRAKLTGRYLNRYFMVSLKGDGVYELHHHPSLGFYKARERKFYRMLIDAVRKFQTGYPDMTLIATSLTLQQSERRKGTTLPVSGIRLLGARLLADVLILTNLANYRWVNGEWCFMNLIRRVHRCKPKRFVLIGGGCDEGRE